MSTSSRGRSPGVTGRGGWPPPGRPPLVAVVGAGVGGLTLVAALARMGVNVELYEQGASSSPAGAGLQLAPNAVRLLHRLGLTDALRAGGVHPRATEVRDWRDDRLHARMPLGRACRELYGVPYYTLQRGHLRQALSALVGHATIRSGRRLVHVEEQADGVRLKFADGSVRWADLVVGADGAGSVVRQALTGQASEEAVPSGSAIYSGLVPSSRVPHLSGRPTVLVWSGPGQRCVCYPVDAGRLMSFAATVPASTSSTESESWTAQGDLSEVRAAYVGWNPAVSALLEAADQVSRWALRDREPLTRWSSDRLTLLGDAADPMLLFMAQGTSQAVEDAVTLARCLRGVSTATLPDALRRYGELRMPRRAAVLAAAREPTVAPTRPLPSRVVRGNAAAELAARRAAAAEETAGLRALAWLYGYDADRETLPPPAARPAGAGEPTGNTRSGVGRHRHGR